jgi:DNA-binding PadR family transcriptional regulator
MRRSEGSLTEIEATLLEVAIKMCGVDNVEFHGFQLAKAHQQALGKPRIIGFGSLYRALDRLESLGYLKSRKEPDEVAREEGRPPRRLYTLTNSGRNAFARHLMNKGVALPVPGITVPEGPAP